MTVPSVTPETASALMTVEAVAEAEIARLADGDIILRDGSKTWVETLRWEERHGLRSDEDTWRVVAYALASALDDQTARAARLEDDLLWLPLGELGERRERVLKCVGMIFGKAEGTS